MTRGKRLQFETIGYWSEVKLAIIKDYATAYSHILSVQKNPALYHIYVDAFAGAGKHISRTTGDTVAGSPMNALQVQPPFREYHFIELDEQKIESLRNIAGDRTDVHLYGGDCNEILLEKVFPQARWQDYHRALVLLDPYGLHLNWEVIKVAATMQSIEIFLNFPVADMNRNVFWSQPQNVDEQDIVRMNAYWGDESWREIAYETRNGLFGPMEVKSTNDKIAEGFRKRLQEVAGFEYVTKPIPMKNANRATIYYLFFASHKPVAQNIVKQIFDKYRNRGIS